MLVKDSEGTKNKMLISPHVSARSVNSPLGLRGLGLGLRVLVGDNLNSTESVKP